MGRAARAKQQTPAPTPIPLPKADYFELRTLIRDLEVLDLEAQKAANEYRVKRAAAQQKCRAKLDELAATHGFDVTGTFGWDDAACALVPTPTRTT